MPRQLAVGVCTVLLWAAGTGAFQEIGQPAEPDTPHDQAAAPDSSEESPLTKTRHSVLVDGRELAYTATAGTITLSKEDGAE